MANTMTTGIRLKDKYNAEVVPAMIKKFGYKNVNEVPKIDKIVLNMGLGDVKDNSKSFNIAVDELAVISVKSQLLQQLRNLSLTSNLELVKRSVLKLLFVVRECMNLWIDLLQLLFQRFVTLEVSMLLLVLTVEVTTHTVLKNN